MVFNVLTNATIMRLTANGFQVSTRTTISSPTFKISSPSSPIAPHFYHACVTLCYTFTTKRSTYRSRCECYLRNWITQREIWHLQNYTSDLTLALSNGYQMTSRRTVQCL